MLVLEEDLKNDGRQHRYVRVMSSLLVALWE